MLKIKQKIKQSFESFKTDVEPINYHNDMSNKVNRLNLILNIILNH